MIRYLRGFVGDAEIVVCQEVQTKMLHAGNQFEPADYSWSATDLAAWINGKPFEVWKHPKLVRYVEDHGLVTDFRFKEGL